jgi:hypothetical protein
LQLLMMRGLAQSLTTTLATHWVRPLLLLLLSPQLLPLRSSKVRRPVSTQRRRR